MRPSTNDIELARRLKGQAQAGCYLPHNLSPWFWCRLRARGRAAERRARRRKTHCSLVQEAV